MLHHEQIYHICIFALINTLLSTRDGNAKGWKEDHCQSGDYEAIDENVLFNIGEKRKAIEIKIKPDREVCLYRDIK
ncbi:unnamed protein product [Trichobilharzia regenti]|nr:unnamed protein product [Trichobilharzia regenti]